MKEDIKSEKLKFLILNPTYNGIQKAVSITNSQNAKSGPFELAVFIGDITQDTEADMPLSISEPVIPIYHTEGSHAFKCSDSSPLNFLGSLGLYKLSNGLKIGFVHGHGATKEEICLKFNGEECDILITYHWPNVIAKEEKLTLVGDSNLDCLIDVLKPRYWFACGGVKGRFFEREAFEIGGRIIRFISLASMGEGRWWYAFQMGSPENDKESVKTIGSRPVHVNDFHKHELTEGNDITEMVKRQKHDKTFIIAPENCYFCLSNPKVELHMIVSIGDFVYLTVAKGPLTLKKGMDFSGHGLIIPIIHYPTLLSYRDNEEKETPVQKTKVFKEIEDYKSRLVKMFNELGDYSVCFWEISRSEGVHYHVQFVPIANNLLKDFEKIINNQIQFTKERYHNQLNYTKFGPNDNLQQLYETYNSKNYMLMTLININNGATKYLFQLDDKDKSIDLQFPRKVLAVLMNLKNRIRWEKCRESFMQESEQKDRFQKAFRPYDFTLDRK